MYAVGQRWFSEAEPELGLGLISFVEGKTIKVTYPASDEIRTYGFQTAPLKRVSYKASEKITTEEGETFTVTDVKEQNGILFYICGDIVVTEVDIKSDQSFTSPHDKIFAGNSDLNDLFNLRYESYLKTREFQLLENKGLLGSKVALIPHQCYVVHEVSKRLIPRVMLADEVGLGKTIEAGLIVKSLILQNKISKVLVITPESLVYQWWVEMLKKFNLSFHMMSSESDSEYEAENINEGEHYIVSLNRLMNDEALQEEIMNTEWDMLIVDEAHQLKYSKDSVSEEYKMINLLSSMIDGLILLSATPEILGQEGHFSRLRLIDPDKFSDLNQYLESKNELKKIVPLVEDLLEDKKNEKDLLKYVSKDELNELSSSEIISTLIDRNGTGRVYFRNTRENMEKNHEFFPKRVLHSHPLKMDGKLSDKLVLQKKVLNLVNVIDKNEGKILIICHSKQMAQNIHKSLTTYTSAPLALFHSDMSIMERDRQAAYFADPEGARVLICTEVGSEGRNFEFASHLYLIDLPKLPDQLEQRIGRLDRIGQKNNINIHVPYMTESFEEILFLWYHEVFNSFNESPKASSLFYAEHREELLSLLEDSFDKEKTKEFISERKINYMAHVEKLRASQDLLVDLNSFNKKVSDEVIKNVNTFNEKHDLKGYLTRAFDLIGVNFEDLNETTYYINPSENMKVPSYPGLSNDGVSVSFEREFSLKRDDISYMSWEHPIALGTLDLFVGSGVGNATVVSSSGKLKMPHFEFIFRLEIKDAPKTNLHEFLPLTPVRVIMDATGSDQTKALPKSKIDPVLIDVTDEKRKEVAGLPKEAFASILKKANLLASSRAQKYKEEALEKFTHHLQKEINRLLKLKEYNPLISEDEIEAMREYLAFGVERIKTTDVSFDAIRVIV